MERLTGERVVLRRWTDADRAPFAILNADTEVMRYFPSPLTADESNSMVDRIVETFERENFGLWALEVDTRFVGYVGLNRTTFETPMGPHVEIGWRLARSAWGYGYASEAARLALDDGFGRLRLQQIFSFTTETNTRSESVMKRVGMRRRRDLDFSHPRTPGWWGSTHIVYSIDATGLHGQPSNRTSKFAS